MNTINKYTMIYIDAFRRKIGVKTLNLSLYFAAYTLMYVFGSTKTAYASSENLSFGISMSPSVIEIHTQYTTPISQPVIVKNLSDQKQDFIIELKQISARVDGTYTPKESDSDYIELFKRISIFDSNSPISSITLNAGEQKKLVLSFNLPQEIEKKDYIFALIIKSSRATTIPTQSESIVSYGTGSIILLSSGKQELNHLNIDQFTTSPFKTRGPILFIARLENDGETYLKTRGELSIQNMFGKVIARSEIMPKIILPHAKKEVVIIKSNGFENNLTDQKDYQLVQWDDRFLFGWYTAKLSVLQQDNKITLATTSFIVLPAYSLLPLIIIVLLSIRLYLRVKRKLV